MLRLKQLRLARELTLHELADLVGTTHTSIQRWESGKRSISTRWLDRLAEALGVHAAEILEPPPGLTMQERAAVEIASMLDTEDCDVWLNMGRRIRKKARGAPKRDQRHRPVA